MRRMLQLGLQLLVMSLVFGQIASGAVAEIRNINVIHDGDQFRIQVRLTNPVIPSVLIATEPDRVVLQLPNTEGDPRQRRIVVNRDGVSQVRVGLNSASPPITRLVVDLDRPHPYALTTSGNMIVLTVLPPSEPATSANNDRVAAAGEDCPVRRWWRRQRKPDPADVEIQLPVFSSRDEPGTNAQPGASMSVVVTPKGKAPRLSFKVKYVAEGAAYLSGGRKAGLVEGMKLVVCDSGPCSADSGATGNRGPVLAELQVVSVADTSVVTEVLHSSRAIKPGDWAYLSSEDYSRLAGERDLGTARDSSLMAESTIKLRDMRPHPVSPEDSRFRARIGLDYSGVRSSGSTPGSSSQLGLVFRTDTTRIAGTYWNLQGYWRGRLTTNSQPLEQTMQDYLDKTYTLQLYYDNPDSKWVAGVGRLYLPWAPSLDTIDGGYVGRRLATGVTTGIFAGSTPNPVSWHYSPDQQIGGAFVNFEGGSYDSFHYTSTTGVALSALQWRLDRPYLFIENGLSFGKYVALYHSFIVDSPQGISTGGFKPGAGISRSYLTLHIQPNGRISFDIYHNYFRDVPTAAPQLIATGLVDKVLYQGLNASVRVEPIRHVTVYTTIGQSDRTGDTRRSLNQMYGIAWSEIAHTGLRADLHYSKFDSSFARGDYRALSVSRYLGDRLLWDAQVGTQNLTSPFTVNNRSLFLDTSFDVNLGRHTFLQSGYSIERGTQLNYNQWYLSLGYRIDSKAPIVK
jgi:AMIN domain-containing protein